MRIGIDLMGGDFAPRATTLGSVLAKNNLPADVQLVLIGDQEQILPILAESGASPSDFDLIHTSEVIEMGEHPAKAFSKKPESSIGLGFKLLKEGKLDGFASAGNTGAMLVGSMFTVNVVPGILRPAICATIPQLDGGVAVLLDVGINADCKPEVLLQYAIIGSIYAEKVLHIDQPRVSLLNIGSEEEKGNILAKTSHEAMKNNPSIHFIGNIEGNELLNSKADVIVCDGFTGNVVLKQAEGFYATMRKRGIQDSFFDRFNFENYGGTPILGVNATVVIGHGISNEIAIKNMILQTYEVARAQFVKRINETFQS